MNKVRFTINAIATLMFTLVFASLAQAQATRTWVSGVGDDLNPCSRTAPCKTFASAITKTADKGEINALDSGGYGAVTITKSVTIDGGGYIAGVLVGLAGNGVVINGSGIDVTLRNLDFNGVGIGADGVKILTANKVSIERCQIYGFTGRAVNDLRVTSSADFKLSVKDSFVRNNGNGIAVVNTNAAHFILAEFDNVRSEGNTLSGFASSNGSKVTIRNSVAANNGSFGFFAEGPNAASEMNLENCLASGNATGASVNTGGTMRLSNVHITSNTGNGVSDTGGTFVSYGNNKISGNAGSNTLGVAPLAGQ